MVIWEALCYCTQPGFSLLLQPARSVELGMRQEHISGHQGQAASSRGWHWKSIKGRPRAICQKLRAKLNVRTVWRKQNIRNPLEYKVYY